MSTSVTAKGTWLALGWAVEEAPYVGAEWGLHFAVDRVNESTEKRTRAFIAGARVRHWVPRAILGGTGGRG
jgi:hypothetical protein